STVAMTAVSRLGGSTSRLLTWAGPWQRRDRLRARAYVRSMTSVGIPGAVARNTRHGALARIQRVTESAAMAVIVVTSLGNGTMIRSYCPSVTVRITSAPVGALSG